MDKKQEETNIHWLFISSQERKEKGQKERKIEVNEHERTLHSFFFLRRQTHTSTQKLYARTCHQLVWSNQNSLYTNRNQNQNIQKINQVSNILTNYKYHHLYCSFRAQNRRIHDNNRNKKRNWWIYLYWIRYEMQVNQINMYFQKKFFFISVVHNQS